MQHCGDARPPLWHCASSPNVCHRNPGSRFLRLPVGKWMSYYHKDPSFKYSRAHWNKGWTSLSSVRMRRLMTQQSHTRGCSLGWWENTKLQVRVSQPGLWKHMIEYNYEKGRGRKRERENHLLKHQTLHNSLKTCSYPIFTPAQRETFPNHDEVTASVSSNRERQLKIKGI